MRKSGPCLGFRRLPMSERKAGGSRYLYEPFDAAQARIAAHEQVTDERWKGLERRLNEIERMLERLEKRMWLAVYGAASLFLANVAVAFLQR